MTPEMRKRIWFFHEFAGWAQDHKMAGAKALAEAEAFAEEIGLEVRWEYDQDPDLDFCFERDRKDFEAGKFDILQASVRDDAGNYLASLGGIWIKPSDSTYRRVVEAELFQEAIAELKKGNVA